MIRISCFLAAFCLTACDPQIMTSSGRAFLAGAGINDPKIAAAARYEPDLRLPARIGLVRLVYGQITTMPEAERTLLAKDLPKGLGTIVPLGPLEAQLQDVPYRTPRIDALRLLGAARHLDMILVIDHDPGENTSEALLIDVANGYPYASIEARAEGSGRRGFWGGRINNPARLDRATLRLAGALKPNLDKAASRLLAEAS